VPSPNLIKGSGNCSLAVNLFYGGILYRLLMRPGELDGTLCPSGGCEKLKFTQVRKALHDAAVTGWVDAYIDSIGEESKPTCW
jgi:hypothetical protein